MMPEIIFKEDTFKNTLRKIIVRELNKKIQGSEMTIARVVMKIVYEILEKTYDSRLFQRRTNILHN